MTSSRSDFGESKLKNRVYRKVFGRWPDEVVTRRLTEATWDPSNVNAIMRGIYEQAGQPVPAEYLDDRPRRI